MFLDMPQVSLAPNHVTLTSNDNIASPDTALSFIPFCLSVRDSKKDDVAQPQLGMKQHLRWCCCAQICSYCCSVWSWASTITHKWTYWSLPHRSDGLFSFESLMYVLLLLSSSSYQSHQDRASHQVTCTTIGKFSSARSEDIMQPCLFLTTHGGLADDWPD